MPGQTSGSCGWCHALNPPSARFCQRCGPEALVARMCCRCPGCTAQPGEVAQAVHCQHCGDFLAWVSAATRESLENPFGEAERQGLAEFLLRLTGGEDQSASLCARCRHSA